MKTYRYEELSDEAKSSALQALHDRYTPAHGWWEYVYESAKEFCSGLGDVDIKGFDSDGWWICWEGGFIFTDEKLDDMAKNFGGSTAQDIIQYMQETLALFKLGREPLSPEYDYFWVTYGVSYRRQSVDIDSSVLAYANECPLNDELFIRLVKIKNDLSDMFLKWLGDEYEYITSDEYVIETADVNDIVFDEEGVIVEC